MVLLEVKDLSKTYWSGNQETQVLRNVNLRIEKGEFVSIMGPSGSGKSTLLYNISGLDRITSGSVMLDGMNLADLSEDELANVRLHKVGFIFQHIHLMKNLTILDNIVLSAYLAKKRNRKQIHQKAKKLMEITGIAELVDHDITQVSGGQLQRAAICRSLINDPDILFGDEPTGALNSHAAGEIMALLSEINRSGMTILLVTHDIKVAGRTERVLFMLDGQLVAEKRLEKYENENADSRKERENLLTDWLINLGF
ncbi:MAG: ABC transporter ATP-binding protein YvcR [Candidatus Carbobacillus altaicus]|uniref:ABC transporter ATP-binding protein YvcR n=1 Tax=Candidatus Carbonibacillus altaicus TaxID=2163959 RepID=A0A2R6XZ53_9BACL|nr:MAG: ABC transporter ATP-binding protein YvcR [Candidatus Carbobacillus altaicus]